MKKIIILVVLLICGCSWRSPNSTFYMMSSQNLEALSSKKMSVAVAKIKVPDLLDRSQMVAYSPKNNQVEIMEFNRWGEIFPDVLQATVVNDLIAYLPQAYVQRTYFDNQSVQYNINIKINNIQAYTGDKVVLSAWWNITDGNGKVLSRHQGMYETMVDGKSIQDLVNAQSQAVHLMSKEIAQTLMKM